MYNQYILVNDMPYHDHKRGKMNCVSNLIHRKMHCRTQEGVKRSMHLKDSMRETCLGDLAEAWHNLVRAYQSANPDLAAAVLNTVERYVNWIDVGLVVNDRSAVKAAFPL